MLLFNCVVDFIRAHLPISLIEVNSSQLLKSNHVTNTKR